MARIRSIHPGFFTDEQIVGLAVECRLLLIALGCEADDNGVFEWKPAGLKMRLFPVDNWDIDGMLFDLVQAGMIVKFNDEGRGYGAIRNFRKHQRPRRASFIHPCPPEIAEFVSAEDIAPRANSGGLFPPNAGIAPQMEGEKEKEREGNSKQTPTAEPGAYDYLIAAGLDDERARAVIEHRQKKRAPLTIRAAKLLAHQFALCPSPNDAADYMIVRGWQGFQAEWMAAKNDSRKESPAMAELRRRRSGQE